MKTVENYAKHPLADRPAQKGKHTKTWKWEGKALGEEPSEKRGGVTLQPHHPVAAGGGLGKG